MTISPQDLVHREVHYCVSALVSTLTQGINLTYDAMRHNTLTDLLALTEQAAELAAPIDDWEEAAIQAGWHEQPDGSWAHNGEDDGEPGLVSSAQAACELDNLDPYQREVYEHWLVSDWLADNLEALGEKVDRDFAGMTIWARTTTGQAIYADGVIKRICADLNTVEVA